MAARATSTPLTRCGFVHVTDRFTSIGDAWNSATGLVDAATPGEELDMIGEFAIPPMGGPPSRDFQTLHHDFGLPLVPGSPADIARFTALHITADRVDAGAVTRLVPLRPLLSQRRWPCRDELVRRFATYGRTHGAWTPEGGYLEGSLARVVEAALERPPVLPPVTTAGFLCGMEFPDFDAELDFFATRGLAIDAVEIRLQPGELLVFDNLALAHGRRGIRQAGELNQRIFGHRDLDVAQQEKLRDRLVLPTFQD